MKKLVFLAAIAAIGMSACNKAEVVQNAPVKQKASYAPASSSIRVFDTFDELSKEVDKTLSMSFDELCAYETANGFNSFGKLADLEYQQVAKNEDDYKSVAEVESVISLHSEYLQLVEDKTGISCETRLYLSPFRYIVNNDKIYQVNDTLVKILEHTTIFTNVNNYKDLLDINEENIENYKDKPSFLVVEKGDRWPYIPNVINHLGKWRDFVDIQNINRRDHKLYVIIYIDKISNNIEKPFYKLLSRRKGILNGVYWWWDRDINYNITVKTGTSSGNTVIDDDELNRRYHNSGIAYDRHDYGAEMTLLNPDITIGTNNYLVRTRGHASYSPNLYVNLDLN
ncbi:MAG: hypothetical protein LBS50_10905 [Prevotellaceae bacterium]|jgi:hypothetical protein|nr:hypothetical protein [Prevotellaceae bacterium]